MNLDGELIGREDKFHKQRKTIACGKIVAAPFVRHFTPGLA